MNRRIKIVSICPRAIISCLFPIECDVIQHIDLELPEGYRVISVNANWYSGNIEAMITHPSFPEVPEGEIPERLPGIRSKYKTFALIKDSSADLPIFRKLQDE